MCIKVTELLSSLLLALHTLIDLFGRFAVWRGQCNKEPKSAFCQNGDKYFRIKIYIFPPDWFPYILVFLLVKRLNNLWKLHKSSNSTGVMTFVAVTEFICDKADRTATVVLFWISEWLNWHRWSYQNVFLKRNAFLMIITETVYYALKKK